MFSIAILIGIYSYSIFSIGLLGFLYQKVILVFTLLFFITLFFLYRKKIASFKIRTLKFPKIFLSILIVQAAINLIGALGPEFGFDALWYHLTFPKIYLEAHKIMHIPGGLLYYSDMPKLTEMLYTSSISLFSEILAKVVHYSFGILVLIAIYKLSRKFLDQKFSILASVIFYSNLVVGWQSTTAYIDLARAFFELMALWGLMNWNNTKENKSARRGWFIESAVMMGLAISTKLLSVGTLFIFLILILYLNRKINKEIIKKIITYFFVSIYVAIPWFIFSFFNTGNPIYPLFSSYVKSDVNALIFNPFVVLKTFWIFFTRSSDPISPIYIIFLPLIFIFLKKLNYQMKSIVIYFVLSLFIWYFFPAKDSRYMLPSLAGLSIAVSYFIKSLNDKFIKKLSVFIIILLGFSSIVYRGVANGKYLPVILGRENRDQFLEKHLNFSFGDFYDIDGYFKSHIKNQDKVLLYGFHNLYYVDFPFIDSSYVEKGDKFNYIAVSNAELPGRFKFWRQIYANPVTGVKLYYLGGQEWVY